MSIIYTTVTSAADRIQRQHLFATKCLLEYLVEVAELEGVESMYREVENMVSDLNITVGDVDGD